MTTQNTTDEHWKRWFVQCSEHMQEVRATELLREAQGGLQHGVRGAAPRRVKNAGATQTSIHYYYNLLLMVCTA